MLDPLTQQQIASTDPVERQCLHAWIVLFSKLHRLIVMQFIRRLYILFFSSPLKRDIVFHTNIV